MPPRTASSTTSDAAANVARPVAGVVGLLAFAADAIILVALVGRVLLGGGVWTGSVIVGLLVVVVFALAAGLSVYGTSPPAALVPFAAFYVVLAALLFLWIGIADHADELGRLLTIATLSLAAVGMGVATSRLALVPVRRLAIPFLVVAAILVVVATVVVIGVGVTGTFADDRMVFLARLLVAVAMAGLSGTFCLLYGRLVSTAPGIVGATRVRPAPSARRARDERSS